MIDTFRIPLTSSEAKALVDRLNLPVLKSGDGWTLYANDLGVRVFVGRYPSFEATLSAYLGRGTNFPLPSEGEARAFLGEFRHFSRLDLTEDLPVENPAVEIERLRNFRVSGQVKPTIHYDNETVYLGTKARSIVVYVKAAGVLRLETRLKSPELPSDGVFWAREQLAWTRYLLAGYRPPDDSLLLGPRLVELFASLDRDCPAAVNEWLSLQPARTARWYRAIIRQAVSSHRGCAFGHPLPPFPIHLQESRSDDRQTRRVGLGILGR